MGGGYGSLGRLANAVDGAAVQARSGAGRDGYQAAASRAVVAKLTQPAAVALHRYPGQGDVAEDRRDHDLRAVPRGRADGDCDRHGLQDGGQARSGQRTRAPADGGAGVVGGDGDVLRGVPRAGPEPGGEGHYRDAGPRGTDNHHAVRVPARPHQGHTASAEGSVGGGALGAVWEGVRGLGQSASAWAATASPMAMFSRWAALPWFSAISR